MTLRHQKNRQNGQKIRWVVGKDHPETCNVTALINMALRKHKMKHPMSLPLAVYKDSKGKMCYLTRAKATEVIRKAVKAVYPDISKEELSKYSSHSFRVWACVTLDEQGIPPDFIKKRLRWLDESYRVYLRDTNKIDDTHLEVLRASASRTMEFVNKVQEDHSLI